MLVVNFMLLSVGLFQLPQLQLIYRLSPPPLHPSSPLRAQSTSNKSNESFCKLHLNYPFTAGTLSLSFPFLSLSLSHFVCLLAHAFIYCSSFYCCHCWCCWCCHMAAGKHPWTDNGTTIGARIWHAKWIKQPKLINTLLVVHQPISHPSLLLPPCFCPVFSVHCNLGFVAQWNWMQIEKQTNTHTHARTALKFTRFPFQLKQFQLQLPPLPFLPSSLWQTFNAMPLRAPLSRQCFLCVLGFLVHANGLCWECHQTG